MEFMDNATQDQFLEELQTIINELGAESVMGIMTELLCGYMNNKTTPPEVIEDAVVILCALGEIVDVPGTTLFEAIEAVQQRFDGETIDVKIGFDFENPHRSTVSVSVKK